MSKIYNEIKIIRDNNPDLFIQGFGPIRGDRIYKYNAGKIFYVIYKSGLEAIITMKRSEIYPDEIRYNGE